MADTYPYRETLQHVADRCAGLFDVENIKIGEPLTDPDAVLQRRRILLQQADPHLVALSQACDGFCLRWQATAAQKQLGLSPGRNSGAVDLLSLSFIYYNWDVELNVKRYRRDKDERYRTLARHLSEFHRVDRFAEHAGVTVGIYYSNPVNPELYIYSDGEGELPYPLGVNMQGYLELLKLSLGYGYWQLLLVELNGHFDGPQTKKFAIKGVDAEKFASDMTKLNPDFTLEKFMARYAEVRLRR